MNEVLLTYYDGQAEPGTLTVRTATSRHVSANGLLRIKYPRTLVGKTPIIVMIEPRRDGYKSKSVKGTHAVTKPAWLALGLAALSIHQI